MQPPKIKLSDGNEIPQIGLGTWQLNSSQCIHTVKLALDLSYKHIDTAETYANEKEIGEAIQNSNISREEFFITSKIWPDHLDYNSVIEKCQESLKNLRTNYLDLYLIHWPHKYIMMEEVLKAMKYLQDQGKIKSFGVSNFTINHLKETLKIAQELNLKITTNQVEFHPLLYQKELLNFCNENNITITAYSPIARGKVFTNNTLREISQKYQKTPVQISLKWLLEKNIIIIPKASYEDHLKENLDLDFEISQEDLDKIDNLGIQERIINPSFAEFDY